MSLLYGTVLVFGAWGAGAQPPAPAGTTSIGGDQYAQLTVTLTITSTSNNQVAPKLSLNDCPKEGGGWDLDTGDFFSGDREATIGVQIVSPDGSTQVLNPVDLVVTRSLLSSKCSINIDHIEYNSPLWYVRTANGSQFHVTGISTTSKSIDPTTLDQVAQFLTAVAPLAGVPAPAVQVGVNAAKNIPVGTATKNTDGLYLAVTAGAHPIKTWTVTDVLPEKNYDVVLTAKLSSVDTVIPAPGGSWDDKSTPGDVLRANFPVAGNLPGGPAQPLGNYINSFATAELLQFNNANSPATAALACNNLKRKIDNIRLSDSDEALVMWALIKNHNEIPDGSTADLLSVRCLEGLERKLPQVLRSVPTPKRPASAVEMASKAERADLLLHFFVDATWNEREDYGNDLFHFPAVLNDAEVLLGGNKSLEGMDSWQVYLSDKDKPILKKIGCYAYVANDGANWVSKLGADSVMLAIGQTPSGKEVALTFAFTQAQPDGDTSIERIDVSDNLSASAKTVLVKAYAKGFCGRAGNPFKPALLFGN